MDVINYFMFAHNRIFSLSKCRNKRVQLQSKGSKSNLIELEVPGLLCVMEVSFQTIFNQRP